VPAICNRRRRLELLSACPICVRVALGDGGVFSVDVIAQDSPDHYHVVQHVDMFGGKTSIYVPSIGRFFVVHTRGDRAKEAGLQVFRVN
jgi:hypothetical protein